MPEGKTYSDAEPLLTPLVTPEPILIDEDVIGRYSQQYAGQIFDRLPALLCLGHFFLKGTLDSHFSRPEHLLILTYYQYSYAA